MIGQIFIATTIQELNTINTHCSMNGHVSNNIVIDDVSQSPYGITASIFLPPLSANCHIIDNNDIVTFANVYTNYLNSNVEVDQMLTIIAENLIAGKDVIFYAPSLADPYNPIPWIVPFSNFISTYYGLVPSSIMNVQPGFNINFVVVIMEKAQRYGIVTEELKSLYMQCMGITNNTTTTHLSSPFVYNGGKI